MTDNNFVIVLKNSFFSKLQLKNIPPKFFSIKMAFIQSYFANMNLEYYHSGYDISSMGTRYHSGQVGALDIDDDDYSESEVGSTEYYADKEYSDESSDDDIRNIFIKEESIVSEESSTDGDYIETNDEEENLGDVETVRFEMKRHKCTSNKKEDSSGNETICVKLESYEISVYEEDDKTIKVEIDSCKPQIVKIKMKLEDNMESHEHPGCEKKNSHEYDQDRMACEALKTIGVKLESGEYFDSLEEFLRYDGLKVKMESSENLCNDDAIRAKMELYKPSERNLNNEQEITEIKIDCNSFNSFGSLEEYLRYNAILPYKPFNCEKDDGNIISMKDFEHSNEENLNDSKDAHSRYSSKRKFEYKGGECHQKQHKRCRLDD